MTSVSVFLKHESKGQYVIVTSNQAALRKLNAAIPVGDSLLVKVDL